LEENPEFREDFPRFVGLQQVEVGEWANFPFGPMYLSVERASRVMPLFFVFSFVIILLVAIVCGGDID
jgi:hypothetical protein